MKKARKKQVVLSVLVLALSVAVYLNWQFAKGGGNLNLGDSVWTGSNYGEAEYVASQDDEQVAQTGKPQDSAYFTSAKTNRTKSRDEALDALQKSLKDTTISAEEKENLTKSLSYIVSSIETESKIESLVKAKGIEDCVVFINNAKCDTVIKSVDTSAEVINQIKEIIVRESGLKAENISIVETK